MQLLPRFPLFVNPVALFGLTLLLGLIGGEIARHSRLLPRISGYIAVGILVGPSGFDIVTPSLLSNARIFVDVSLGLILFDLGRHLDFTWLRHDAGLLPMALAESSLTFLFTFLVLCFFQLSWLSAALGATIAVATSPAVVMMVAHDLSAKGPVTRRALILASLDNFFGVVLFTLLLPATEPSASVVMMAAQASYRLLGSMGLGLIMFLVTVQIAKLIGKRKENQFVLFVGTVIFTIGLATLLNFSSMLTLFTLGVAARNFDHEHILMEVDFGWLARLFFILLFVITGVQLQLKGIWQATWAVLAFLFARLLGKSCGTWLFAKKSRLTTQQAWAVCFTLTPMAEMAIGMSSKLFDFNPDIGYRPMIIITAVVAILYILSPIANQLAFIKTGEAATTDETL